jgi:arabinofuranosyltransferase
VAHCSRSFLRVCHSLGDEYGWYLGLAGRKHPVRLADYQAHPFYQARTRLGGDHTVVGETESYGLGHGLDPEVTRALFGGAIGILGFSLPLSVHVIDKHGLSEPVVARFELAQRGRPGHEKILSTPWLQARYAAPSAGDLSDVLAARHALACGEAADLLASIRGPVSARMFVHNVWHARAHSRLRIAPEPFQSERALCGGTLRLEPHGGSGGGAFTWMCPEGQWALGIEVSMHPEEHALRSVRLVCSDENVVGTTFGERVDRAEKLLCPAGKGLRGVRTTADKWVRSVGLMCGDAVSREAADTDSNVLGTEQGEPVRVMCNKEERVGLTGRSGSLIDAIGVACARP